jgi:hypothetical protein
VSRTATSTPDPTPDLDPMLPLALAFALPLLLLLAAPTPEAAVSAALARPSGRIEVLAVRTTSTGCAAESFEVREAIEASGDVPLRLAGRDRHGGACTGAAWASVRVFAPALVTSRALREGEPLEPAVVLAEREVRPSRPTVAALPEGATASRALRAREALAPGDVRTGPRPGGDVTVVVRAGALEIERAGRALPCPRERDPAGREARACALLPGGRKVEGRYRDGRILVEAP